MIYFMLCGEQAGVEADCCVHPGEGRQRLGQEWCPQQASSIMGDGPP